MIKVGLISRLDYGLLRYRRQLIKSALNIFKREKVKFIVIAGGLMDKEWNQKNYIKEQAAKSEKKLTREDVEKLKAEFLETAVRELSGVLEEIIIDGVPVKYYIVTSKIYDKEIGEAVAEEISRRRKDVSYVDDRRGTFEVKGVHKNALVVLTPHKAPWRNNNFSTPVQRVLNDELSTTEKPGPLVYAVGCFGVAMFKPGGPYPHCNEKVNYCSVPVISRAQYQTIQDNEAGCVILEFDKNKPIAYKCYGLKDLLANEKNYFCIKHLRGPEKKIIETFKAFDTPPTIGQLEAESGINRNEIMKIIAGNKKLKSIIRKSEDGKRYRIYMGDIVRYPEIKIDRWEKFVAFGCLHVPCRWTDYNFIDQELPKIIAMNDVNYVVGVGDFVEGTEHNLLLQGEVLAGLNNTKQEELSADVVANALFKTFLIKLEARRKNKALLADVKNLFPYFYFIPGNHCEWSLKAGYEPLRNFKNRLIKTLMGKMSGVFKNHDFAGLYALIQKKISGLDVFNPIFTTESNIKCSLYHPHLPRAMALSGRLQAVNAQAADLGATVNFVANFHTHVALQAWSSTRGDVLAVQVGTLKVRSNYEYLKNKNVDFGVALVEIGVDQNGRLVCSRVVYHTTPSGRLISNDDIETYMRSKIFGS